MRVLVKMLLPLTFAENHEVHILHQLCTKDFPTITVETTRHIMVEMFIATKEVRVKSEGTTYTSARND